MLTLLGVGKVAGGITLSPAIQRRGKLSEPATKRRAGGSRSQKLARVRGAASDFTSERLPKAARASRSRGRPLGPVSGRRYPTRILPKKTPPSPALSGTLSLKGEGR